MNTIQIFPLYSTLALLSTLYGRVMGLQLVRIFWDIRARSAHAAHFNSIVENRRESVQHVLTTLCTKLPRMKQYLRLQYSTVHYPLTP